MQSFYREIKNFQSMQFGTIIEIMTLTVLSYVITMNAKLFSLERVNNCAVFDPSVLLCRTAKERISQELIMLRFCMSTMTWLWYVHECSGSGMIRELEWHVVIQSKPQILYKLVELSVKNFLGIRLAKNLLSVFYWLTFLNLA